MLLQGLSATILRNTPANAVYLGNFEMMKRAYCNQYNVAPDKIPGWVVLCAAGGCILMLMLTPHSPSAAVLHQAILSALWRKPVTGDL
jgi:hypothetical protein